jgi:hypothetical protein
LFKSQAGKELLAQAAAVGVAIRGGPLKFRAVSVCAVPQSRGFVPGEAIEGVVPLGSNFTPAQRALMEVCGVQCAGWLTQDGAASCVAPRPRLPTRNLQRKWIVWSFTSSKASFRRSCRMETLPLALRQALE